jgi:glutamate synthase domain-containing protein 3
MAVIIKSAPSTGSLPGRLFAIVEQSDASVRTIYEFAVRDDGDHIDLVHVLPVAIDHVDEEVPENVRESVEASGYSIVDEDARTDGGSDAPIATIRTALQTAKEVAPEERDAHIKVALGEVVWLRAADVAYTGELQEILTSVLVAPDEEAPYFINQALSLLEDVEDHIDSKEPIEVDAEITNRDRAVGATLSNRIVTRHGPEGLPDGSVQVAFAGTAGQSFGAFLAPGVTFDLEGAANDYLGKGLSGGTVVVRTPDEAGFDPAENTVIGNVALYGATGGEVYVNGVAGERFAVRNSGVRAVVEGVGDHGCEYMTDGIVAVLGETGKNFAAGMSGGIAYVYDPEGHFESRCNDEMVDVVDSLSESDAAALRRLVEKHAAYTGSERATSLLADWEAVRGMFMKVMPQAYARAIEERPGADARRRLPSPAEAHPGPIVEESAD